MPQKWNRVKGIVAEKEGIDFKSNSEAVEKIFEILIEYYGEKIEVEKTSG